MRPGHLLLAALSLLSANPVSGQGPATAPSRQAAMKRFDLWIGKWTGSGWSVDATGRRTEFDLVETVTPKTGGTVLLVEGRGTAKPDTGNIVVTHDGLTLLYFDEHTGRYRWNGHEARSGTVDAEVTPVDGGFQWSITAGRPGAMVRFTILHDATSWREVGEATADGKTWNKFMAINLQRSPP